MFLSRNINKRTLLTTVSLVMIAIAGFASTANASIYGNVAQYSSRVTCRGYTNYNNYSVGIDSPTIYLSPHYSQQRVEWFAVLYQRTGSSMQIVNVLSQVATISGPSYFSPLTFRSDSSGRALKGQYLVRSLVYWFDATGAILDADDLLFTQNNYWQSLNGSAWSSANECSF
jgi:hypothetical protein